MGRSRTAATRDEAASEREVRSKWGDWVGYWGGRECVWRRTEW